MKDPIVDEVRATREQIAEQAGFDLRRILDHARDAASRLSGLGYVSLEELRTRRAGTQQQTQRPVKI